MSKSFLNLYQKLLKFENLLSIIGAFIQIGLLVTSLLNVIPLYVAVFSAIIVLSAFVFQDLARKNAVIKKLKAEEILRKHFPSVKLYLDSMRSVEKQYIADSKLSYKKMILTFEILGLGAKFTKRVIGQNLSSADVTEMIYRCCADNVIDNNGKMCFSSERNPNSNHSLILDSRVVLSRSNFKIFAVELNPPIERNGGAFDIAFSVQWPYAFTSNYDYVFVPLFHHKRGIGEIQVNIISRNTLKPCGVWTWDLKKHGLKPLKAAVQVRKYRSKYSLKWKRTDPNIDKIYIIGFYRDVAFS